MRKSKRWLAFLATLAMLLGTFALPLAADGTETEKHIRMEKTEYYEDEPIEIIATGDTAAKDWVGYNVNGNTGNSLLWWYITEENKGKSVNLLTGKPVAEGDTGLPAGEYWAFFVPSNQNANKMTETVSFVVKRRPAAPTDPIDPVCPEGDGSWLYPYLIGSAGNLSWMAKQIGSGIDPTGAVNPFAGKYFRQTCDIDLGGRVLNPIGYAYLDAENHAVFGGDYDGQGYKIFNGSIRDAETYDAGLTHGSGLFGVICNAAIRNVVLERVSVSGAAVVGGVVGLSVTAKENADTGANLVEKCRVGEGCSVTAETKDVSGSYSAPQRIGGVVGLGQAMTVSLCVNEAEIDVSYGIKTAGGIMGGADSHVTIRNSVNKGTLKLDCTKAIYKPEGQMGGILGYIFQTVSGNHLIENCYNIGGMEILTTAATPAMNLSLGGILGASNTLVKGYTHEIKNCCNLTERVTAEVLNGNAWNWRIGEIVGCAYQPDKADATALKLTNCYGVGMPIASTAVEGNEVPFYATTWYTGYPHNNYDKDAAGNITMHETYGLANYRNFTNKEGTKEIVFTDCGYKTAAELKTLADTVDAAIDAGKSEQKTDKKVLTDRRFYFEGEDILVYANGNPTGKDWVGIKPKDDGGNSIYWYYITAENIGKPVNIRAQKKSSRPSEGDYDLPAGDYTVFWVENDQLAGAATESVDITVTRKVAADRDTYYEGEPIYVRGKTADPANKDWVGIVPLDDPDKNGYSVWWYYLTAENNMKPFNLREGTKSSRENAEDYALPAGAYRVFFVPKDGYASGATESITIRILKEGETRKLEAPENVTYTLKNSTDGMADGTLTVRLTADSPAKDIVMYWANAEGRLSGYTALARFKVTDRETVHEMTANTIIPEGATRLLVYTASGTALSEECFPVELPEGAAHKGFGKLLKEFQVISDIHLNTDNSHLYNQNFEKVLEDIAANSPQSAGIYIVGDMANNGKAEEYANIWTIYNKVREGKTLPQIYMAIGNHDFYGNNAYADSVKLFLENAKLSDGSHPEKLYFDFWEDGYHYVFLGTDRYPISNVNAYLDKNQLAWLDKTLAENRDLNRPTFVFLHQSLYNTVAGSFEGQGWNGATPDKALRDVLKKYPEVVMFNGHSHWTLDSEGCMHERTEDLPLTIFNTASTAYLWTSYNKVTGEALAGSQGYYVRIYEKCVAVLGRDFATGEWIPSALFVADYSDMSRYETDDPVNPEPGGDTSAEQKETQPEPSTGSDTAGAQEPEAVGCQSALGAGLLGVLATSAVAPMLLRRRKRED